VPRIAAWVYYVVGAAFTAAVVGWLTGLFGRAPSWMRQAIGMFRRWVSRPPQEPPPSIDFMPGGGAIAHQVDIDLRGDAAVTFQMTSQIPQLFLWFEVANRSPVDLQLDRMLLEVWINTPLIYGGPILNRVPLPSGKKLGNVYFAAMLSAGQVAEIRRMTTPQGYIDGVQVRVTAYFQAREGWIEVSKQITRSKVLVG
jgi:hypothetical protein